MTRLSAKQRGDMAEKMLPEAAGLVVDVHESTPDLIAARLHGLDRHQLEGLAVVLAAMVDPDRGLSEALGWVTFDEYGQPLEKPSRSLRSVRDMVPKQTLRSAGVDEVAVERALRGDRDVVLSQSERRHAVDVGLRRGMGYENVAHALGMEVPTVKRSWERGKQRARAEGRSVPGVRVDEIRQAVG